jgi:formylglycine-generating enzyme required for sulfatase activity
MPSNKISKSPQILSVLTLLLAYLFPAMGNAQAEKIVVVIPMAGEDAISHPVAKTFTNSIGMQFNELPAGSFTMGSPGSEPGRFSDEVEHTVTLSKAFKMQVTEVTNAQWNDVIVESTLGNNPSSSHPGDNDYPVERVSWFDAVLFANRLSQDESRSPCYIFAGITGTPGSNLAISSVIMKANCTGYSLPTEAQWEYAARAGTTKAYANPVGFDDSDIETGFGFNGNLNTMGWYWYNRVMENGSAVTAYEDGTKPVAKKQANAWGLYDMHGNVWEWTWNALASYSGDATDPSGPSVPNSSIRMRRGGGWADTANYVRSANRYPIFVGSTYTSQGFRLVLPQGQ